MSPIVLLGGFGLLGGAAFLLLQKKSAPQQVRAPAFTSTPSFAPAAAPSSSPLSSPSAAGNPAYEQPNITHVEYQNPAYDNSYYGPGSDAGQAAGNAIASDESDDDSGLSAITDLFSGRSDAAYRTMRHLRRSRANGHTTRGLQGKGW